MDRPLSLKTHLTPQAHAEGDLLLHSETASFMLQGELMQNCVACHATYRLEAVSTAASSP